MNEHAAPGLPPLLDRILERAITRLARISGELDGLARHYAEREDLPGIKTLIGALRLVVSEAERDALDEARSAFVSIEQAAGDPGAIDTAARRLRDRVGGLIAALELVLPRPLDVARMPHGREIEALVPAFTRMATEIAGSRELIFEPTDRYESQDSLVEDMQHPAGVFSPRLRKALAALPHLTVIGYPTQLDADTLLHLVVVHELAHLAYDKTLDGAHAPATRLLIEAAIDEHYEDLRDEVEAQEGRIEDEETLGDRVGDVEDRLKDWFEELACDALALALCGPAYAFALADFEMPANRWAQEPGDPGYDTHPGLAWRLERLIEPARTWLPAEYDDAVAAAHAALDTLASVIPTERDELGEVERRIIDRALAGLDAQLIARVLGPATFDPGTLRRDLPVVWEKLGGGIPPAERILRRTDRETQQGGDDDSSIDHEPWSEPLDWRSILNGCYVHWLAGPARSSEQHVRRTAPLSPTAVSDWVNFNELVRGTLELAETQRLLDETRLALRDLAPPTAP